MNQVILRVYYTEAQKAERPETYILNPESGKWVLRDSTAGRKIAKGISAKQLVRPPKVKKEKTGTNPYEPKRPINFVYFKELTMDDEKNKNKTASELSREYDQILWQFNHETNLFSSDWWSAFVLDQRKGGKHSLPVDLWRMVSSFLAPGGKKLINPGNEFTWSGYVLEE